MVKTMKYFQIGKKYWFFMAFLAFAGCSDESSPSPNNQPADLISPKSSSLMEKALNTIELNEAQEFSGLDFSTELAPLSHNYLFSQSPTGSYVNEALANYDVDPAKKLRIISDKQIEWLGEHQKCFDDCSEEFKQSYAVNRNHTENRLFEMAEQVIKNEIRNPKYTVFYHGFPSSFRLYQDVLKEVVGFEILDELNTTWLFRQYDFGESIDSLDKVLANWWGEYLKYAESKGQSPKPKADEEEPSLAKSVGLRYFPDSIFYAQKYLLSTNISLFANNLSLLNNSIFYFLNNRSATGLNIADSLIEALLKPYVIDANKNLDEEKLKQVVQTLRGIYNKYLANGGGQLAQIFIKKSVAPKISYMAWNGGEPMWFSKERGGAIYAKEKNELLFKPTNVFWPDEKQSDYYLPDPNIYIDWYINNPSKLYQNVPILGNLYRNLYLGHARGFLKLVRNQNTIPLEDQEIFAIKDISQARVMPKPSIFSDENLVGVKIYTSEPLSDNDIEQYYSEIRATIKAVFSEFLGKVRDESFFKSGSFPLKNLFLESQKNK